jgi:hypothetical protein
MNPSQKKAEQELRAEFPNYDSLGDKLKINLVVAWLNGYIKGRIEVTETFTKAISKQ